MKYAIVLIAVLFVGCGEIVVRGETKHLVGIDTEGLRDLFENSCRTECEAIRPKLSGSLLNQCTEACIAEEASNFLDMIGTL